LVWAAGDLNKDDPCEVAGTVEEDLGEEIKDGDASSLFPN
jgi:hypothetical protein